MKAGDPDISVLMYYGIGGIGKSTLVKKLISEMKERLKKPQYVYYDFGVNQDSRSVLERICNLLAKDCKFSFPLFDLALYNYAQKIGEDVESPKIQSFTSKSELLGSVLDIAGNIPVVGFATQLIKCADSGVALIRNLLNNHKRELIEIEIKSPDELYAHLPYLFAQDLANNLAEQSEPMVIFLDTYEKLVNEMSSISEPLNNDLWIRGEHGLIQNVPNVLWVITGRERLKWEEFEPEWSASLHQHILGSLTQKDSAEFLRSAGITDTDLLEGLYDLTRGTPVYLDLCVDRYDFLIENGKNRSWRNLVRMNWC